MKMLDLSYNEMWTVWNDSAGENNKRSDIQTSKPNLVLSWKRLSVSVENKTTKWFGPSKITNKQLLINVSGKVESGSILSILGPSGSGKTTLLAAISHRKIGNVQGELLLNGCPVSESNMIKLSGFVSQEDISFVQLTVLEQLKFIAWFMMDRDSTEKLIEDRINYLTSNLCLTKVLNTRVCFLSGGERKKVALAIQLINDPPILFCDEITTGLDSSSAAYVIKLLREIAQSGKIVICTVHQPASGLIDQFNEVMFLTDGRLAYQGPVSLMDDMFKKYNYICPATYNKVEYIISILSSETVLDKSNVNDMCINSLASVVHTEIQYDEFKKDVQSEYGLHLQLKKINWFVQTQVLFYRLTTCSVIDYKEKLLEMANLMLLGIIIASSYTNIQFDTNASRNWEGFWVYFVLTSVWVIRFRGLLIYQIDIPIIHRELSNKVYSLSAYYVSQLIFSVLWMLINVELYSILVYWIVGVNWTFKQLLAFSIIEYASFAYGNLFSAHSTSVQTAAIYSGISLGLTSTLTESFVSFKSLPKWAYALRYASLFFYGEEIMSTLFWLNANSISSDEGNCYLQNHGKAVLDDYGFISENIYLDLMILIIFSLFANIFGYIGIRKRMKTLTVY